MKITLFDAVRFIVATIVICCLLIIIRGFNELDDMKEHTIRIWWENGLIAIVLVSVFLLILKQILKSK